MISIGGNGDSFRSRQQRLDCRPCFRVKAFLARSGDMKELPLFHVDAEHLVSFPQSQPEVAVRSSAQRTGTSQGSFLADGSAVIGRHRLAGSTPRVDDSRFQIDRPDAVVSDVADKKRFAFCVELDRMRPIECCLGRRTAVTGKSGLPGTGHRLDHIRSGIELSYDVIRHLHPVEITGWMEANFVRLIRLRFRGCSSITGVSLFPGAYKRVDGPLLPRYATNGVIVDITENDIAPGSDDDPVGIVDLCLRSRSPVTGVSLLSCTRDGLDCRFRQSETTNSQNQKP